MKQRRFYPRQVLRALEGRETPGLSRGETCALRYFLLRARKLGQPIFLMRAPTDLSSLASATDEERRAVFENSNTRIFLSLPQRKEGGVCVFDAGPASIKALQTLGGAPLHFHPGASVSLNPFSDQAAS
ncbi:hypothetical protein AB4Y45_33690 [Paraburkholderia sp. EG287A]|uniref:hypothetical protein n=1 Tax=Paraburkholderia sp. EG287A TaxID=3237012 RepID=UPI0034D1BC76